MSVPDSSASSSPRREQLSFFRQSGWMLVANLLGGAFFTFVHTPVGQIAKIPDIGKSEYATFGALLDSLILLSIPAAGLQAAFAQLASGAVSADLRDRLRSTLRSVLLVVVSLWCFAALTAVLRLGWLQQVFQVREPWAIGFILVTALVQLVYPVFAGLLQGTQNFFWLGNAIIASGAGRLLCVSTAVLVFGALAAGALAGVMLGALAALSLAVWASRAHWWGLSQATRDWSWVRPRLALTLGLAAGSVMLSADSTFVQSAFSDDDRALYIAAGRVGRALVFLTMPVALVLFPHVARSASTGRPTDALRLALGATLGTGIAAALVCTAVPGLTIYLQFFGNPVFQPAAELVPLFCWCMLPLTAAYTLVNNLLARRRFAAVPWLLLVAAGYSASLAALRPGILQRASPLLRAEAIQPAFLERLRQPQSPLDHQLLAWLPSELKASLTAPQSSTPSPLPQLTAPIVFALNPHLADLPASPDLLNGIAMRPETQALLQRSPGGIDRQRLGRMLLEDAYANALVPSPPWRVLDEFRRVIRTLGLFSILLLSVSVLFSLERGAARKAARPT